MKPFQIEKAKKKETNDAAIKDIRNPFRLKKENRVVKDRILTDIRNLFELGDIRNIFIFKENNKVIKDWILRDIRNLSEFEEEENYYKPVRESSFWSNNYIQHESKCDRNKALSVKEYLNKIRPYLKSIYNLKKSDTWKIQLTFKK